MCTTGMNSILRVCVGVYEGVVVCICVSQNVCARRDRVDQDKALQAATLGRGQLGTFSSSFQVLDGTCVVN